MDLSIVIPVFNEEANINVLYNELDPVIRSLKTSYEIIFVDDGSVDNTLNILKSINENDKNVKIIRFRRNFGQTAAISAGFNLASGNIIITLDGDLQNDPRDIPKLIEKLDEGFDVVSGWRFERKDSFSKKNLSMIANYLRKKVTGEALHDSGCSLKAYKKECFENLNLYGEMHRYIPTILRWNGFKIGEIKVNHRPRKFGGTKYNYKRIFRGFFDLLSATFLMNFFTKPLHFFGSIGIFLLFLGMTIGFINIGYYYFVIGRVEGIGPILLFATFLAIGGFQFLLFGLLGELLIWAHFQRTQKNYSIEKIYTS